MKPQILCFATQEKHSAQRFHPNAWIKSLALARGPTFDDISFIIMPRMHPYGLVAHNDFSIFQPLFPRALRFALDSNTIHIV